MPYLAGYITPQDYGAAGNGTTDDTAAINAALTAAATTGVQVYLTAATYLISTPLSVPSNVPFESMQGLRVQGSSDPAPLSVLKLAAGFSGNGAIVLPSNSAGQRVRRINVDGTLAAGSVAGLYAVGYVHDVFLEELHLYKLPGDGIHLAPSGGNQPYSWTMTSVTANGCAGAGFNLASTTDSTLMSCQAIGCTGNGFTLVGVNNSNLTSCRAEYNAVGYSISGSWASGTGAGGMTMNGCSTDRNISHGLSVTATGNAPININGHMARRDGSNGTDFGVNLNTTMPTTIQGLSVFPGVNDDGTGTNTPVTGVQAASCTYAQLNNSYVQGATSAVVDGGGNTFFLQSPNVGTATGTTSSPTRPSAYYWSTPLSLDITSQALGVITPRSHGLIAWTDPPGTVPTGATGLVAGTVYLARLDVNRALTGTKLYWGINTAGSGVTSGQNFIGLYNQAGTRLASVGIDARITSTGLFTETISAAVTPGLYWVAWVINATTMPQIFRHDALNTTLLNINQGTTNYRCATNVASQTSLPSPLTPSSSTPNSFPLFAALQ